MTIEAFWENIQRWATLHPFGGELTVLQILIGLILLFVLLKVTRKLLFNKLDRQATAIKEAECNHCGWRGRLQISIRRCPQCGKEDMRKRT